ncbi:acid phosphatase [Mycolicibacterium cyprinidarum]|uniref:Acid phosphatase n=1 Tax=Mycolicibacterium cyprinidarum TaxID=2860311 RepID=A0ABQ4VA68_9MYCO|nr:acid phosphatase [Mycolicibacterium sp. NGTWS0302]GJF15092.1 acid phosphatase [Mycolicibacterium sp. NGTWSNA01]GJF17241.1 acid phosphatase [Mycolicibacterium sp. NGTWS1803]
MGTLDSWTDGPTKSAIVDFVGRVTTAGPDFVSPEARVAVFDNDGTLWCEKPMYIQLDFIVRRLVEQATADSSLAEQQPYRAACSGDLQWFGAAITKHYQGDDADLKVLAKAIMSLHQSMKVEDHAEKVAAFFAEATHPTLGRPYKTCTYRPMVELLRYLEEHGFTCYIVSGGGRDFMRPITGAIYGIPPERVVGSSQGLAFEGTGGTGDLLIQPVLDVFDDGPEKPVRVWNRIGRRPILAAGNTNGDDEMLRYSGTSTSPSLRIVILHDDADREFAYTAGAERVLEHARDYDWTVVSMKNDWTTVFGE